jgi:pimeloyl-ACP methyl ester carboxylesterase
MLHTRSWSKLILMGGVLMALGVVGGGARVARADAAAFSRGDVLIEFGSWCSEECVGDPSDALAVYGQDGTFKGFMNTGTTMAGPMATDAAGNIFVVGDGEVLRIPVGGGSATPFLALAPGQFFSASGLAFDKDDSLFVSGTLYYDDGQGNGGIVGSGVFRASGSPQFFEQLSVAPLTLDVAGLGVADCTLVYWATGQAKRYDWCAQAQRPDFVTGPGNPFDGRLLADESIVTASISDIQRTYPDGLVRHFGAESCITSADVFEGRVYYTLPCQSEVRYIDMVDGSSGLFKAFDAAEIASYGGVPVRVRVNQGPAAGRPKPPIIYVHGWGGSVNDRLPGSKFFGLLSKLEPSEPTRRFAGNLIRFQYFEDEGSDDPNGVNGVCVESRSPRPRPLVTGSMAAVVDTTHTAAKCDSQGDIALNAAAMEQTVVNAFERAEQKQVVIVAHSMGAAITRGFLAYSQDLGDGVALRMFRGAIFLEGAHDGIWALPALTLPLSLPFVGGGNEFRIGDWITVDTTRPGNYQLQPKSAWYQWANSYSRGLLPGNYYNVYGDIRLKVGGCAWLCFDVPLVPVSAGLGVEVQLGSVGDGIIFPGSDSPFDTPGGGGARFKRPVSSRDHQWAITQSINWRPTGVDVVDGGIIGTELFEASKVFHFRFSGEDLGQFTVANCAGGGPVSLQEQLLLLLEGLTGETSYQCLAQ